MMISLESYIEMNKDKPYKELLNECDASICKIRNFEKQNYDSMEDLIHPSPEVRYTF